MQRDKYGFNMFEFQKSHRTGRKPLRRMTLWAVVETGNGWLWGVVLAVVAVVGKS